MWWLFLILLYLLLPNGRSGNNDVFIPFEDRPGNQPRGMDKMQDNDCEF